MIENSRKVMHIILGFTIVLIGIAGLVLPILNGVLFLIIGLIILSFESEKLEHKLLAITKKNNTIHSWHLKLEKILRKLFRKER